jgi:4-amino-4-deoxy-L-arabinose transferase-like glycosyltransferase
MSTGSHSDVLTHVSATSSVSFRRGANRRVRVTIVIETDQSPPTAKSTLVRRWSATDVACCIAVVLAGSLARSLVLRSSAGSLTADEAYVGVQSFEMLKGQFPVVLGGTAYTLPLEAYLYVPVAAVAGANPLLLKLLTTVSWGAASILLALVGRRFAGRRVGLIAAALCWFTPGALLVISVTAYAAYASGMFVSVAALYIAAIVVDADEPHWLLTSGFGLVAGFGFWLHPMFLASLVPMVGVVLWTHRRRVRACCAVVTGAIVGCGPLLAWNAINSWPSLDTPADAEGSYFDRLRTFAVNLIPRAFGLRDIQLEWQPNGVIAPALYGALVCTSIAGLWMIVRRPGPRSRALLPAVLIGVFPIMALFENLIFAFDGRYGVISFPFIVLAIAIAIDALIGRERAWRAGGVVTLVGVVWVLGFVGPTVRPLLDATKGDPNAQLEAIVDRLDEAGIDRIYGSYWAVLPVDFVGDRRIVGGVFPFWPIRFPERQRTVEATPITDIAILFLTSDEEPIRLPMPVENYERSVFGDIVLYLPIAAPGDG